MSITFSTCFYIINSKFPPEKYIEWMNNLLFIVNNFNLVIYTDENALQHINNTLNNNLNNKLNPKIKIIVKSLDKFYNYKYKDFWIKNHEQNILLNNVSSWELNMLWAEKIHFVKETIEKAYFDTEFYGWCDIGYFRNRSCDTNINLLINWPVSNKINNLPTNKVIYACVNNNGSYLNSIIQIINNKNADGLPVIKTPSDQVSIAGGFFILHKKMINWWFKTFNNKLNLYFKHNYLVKDDQIIIADCVFSDLDKFLLCREYQPPCDNWFMFQRILN